MGTLQQFPVFVSTLLTLKIHHLYIYVVEKIEKIIDILQKEGLNGLEVEYNSYTEKQRKHYNKLAENKKLLKVGGSDFHGENRLGVNIGVTGVDEKEIIKLRKVK